MWRSLLLVIVAACGGGRAAPPPVAQNEVVAKPTPIGSADAAIARFDELFPELLEAATPEQRATIEDLDRARREGRVAGPTAGPRTCAEVGQWVTSSLGPDTRSIVVGTAGELTAQGDRACWVVSLAVRFSTLLMAIAEDDGALLLAWLPPEG